MRSAGGHRADEESGHVAESEAAAPEAAGSGSRTRRRKLWRRPRVSRLGRARPGRFRRWFLRPVLWGLAALAVFVFVAQLLLDTPWARRTARDLITSQLSDYLQRRVEIVELSVELLPLSVEVEGFEIGGPNEGDPPFVRVPFATIDADLNALQHRKLHLQRVRVERPEVYLQFFPDRTSNIPKVNREKRKRRPRTFEILIDRLEIEQVTFGLDQDRVQLSLATQEIRSRFHGLGDLKVGGDTRAREVVIRLPRARPITVDVDVDATVEGDHLDVLQASISGPDLDLEAEGTCDWTPGDREDRKCQFDARGTATGRTLSVLGYFEELEGAFELEGALAWRPGATGWRGRIRAGDVRLWDRRVQDLESRVAADRYGLRGQIESARYAGGLLSGEVLYERTPDAAPEDLVQTLTVDLDYRGLLLDTLLEDQGIASRGYATRADGDFFYRFPFGEAERGDGRAEIELVADGELPGLPLESGALPLRIEAGVVRADAISARSARQSVLADGWYDLERKSGAFDYEIASFDLAELVPLLPAVEPGSVWVPAAGQGQLSGTLYVDPGDVATDLGLRLEKVATSSGTFERVQGNLFLTPQGLNTVRLELGDADSALMLRGRMPFESTAADSTQLVFDAFNWPLASVHPWIDFSLPVDGFISGRLHLHVDDVASDGRLAASVAPATVILAPSPDAEPFEQALDKVAGRLSWNGDGLRFHELDLIAASGTVRGEGTYLWTDGEVDVELRSEALELSAPPLSEYLPRRGIAGEVAVLARIEGPMARPRIELEVGADTITLAGRVLEARPSRLEVRSGDGRWQASGRLLDMVTVRGEGRLDPDADLRLGLEGSNLSGLLDLLFEEPPADVDGTFAGSLTVAGGGGRIDLELAELLIELRGRRLANLEPVILGLTRDQVAVTSFRLGEEASGSHVSVQGHLGLETSAPVELAVESTLAADWLELTEMGLDLEGFFDLDAHLRGPLDGLVAEGRGRLRDGRLALAAFPYPIENLEGTVVLAPGTVVIERLEGDLAGGRVTLEGQADFTEPGVEPAGAIPQYRLRARAAGLQMLYPEGWTVEGGTELTLRSVEGGHRLDGLAELTRLEYREDLRFDFAELLRGFLRRQRLEIDPADSLLSTVQVHLDIEARDALRVRNNLAQIDGGAELSIRGNMAQPVLYGSVDVDEGGTVIYNSTDYEVDRGRITFTNPYRLDPEIDVVLTTEVRDFDISMALSGTLERLDTRFSSEPPLPDLEVFRLLATGDIDPQTTVLEPTVSDTRLADRRESESTSAATFLYGQAAAVVGERFSNLFGFDKFRIDPLTGSGDNLSKTRFTVGKRISKDFFLTYSVDPSSTEEQRLQLEWQISPGLVLVLTQNGDNSYTADARWESSF